MLPGALLALLLQAGSTAAAAGDAAPKDEPKSAGARTAEREPRAQVGEPGPGLSFVIPRDTCQQGEPLQILRSKPAPSGISRPRRSEP